MGIVRYSSVWYSLVIVRKSTVELSIGSASFRLVPLGKEKSSRVRV